MCSCSSPERRRSGEWRIDTEEFHSDYKARFEGRRVGAMGGENEGCMVMFAISLHDTGFALPATILDSSGLAPPTLRVYVRSSILYETTLL